MSSENTAKTTITGVAFPIPKQYMSRFLTEGRNVFVKPATTYKELRRGMRLVFYQSHEDTGYAGEATIKRILIAENPFSFYDTYGDAVFLEREEMHAYLEKQERWRSGRARKGEGRKRSWMALELEDIRAYPVVRKTERFVPVGGEYLRQ